MAKMPKDYSRHQNKLIGNLSVKSVVSLATTGFVLILLLKSGLPLVLKVILFFPLLILGLLFTFYKSIDGDDFMSYIFNALMFYTTPKHLVFKRKNSNEGDELR